MAAQVYNPFMRISLLHVVSPLSQTSKEPSPTYSHILSSLEQIYTLGSIQVSGVWEVGWCYCMCVVHLGWTPLSSHSSSARCV